MFAPEKPYEAAILVGFVEKFPKSFDIELPLFSCGTPTILFVAKGMGHAGRAGDRA